MADRRRRRKRASQDSEDEEESGSGTESAGSGPASTKNRARVPEPAVVPPPPPSSVRESEDGIEGDAVLSDYESAEENGSHSEEEEEEEEEEGQVGGEQCSQEERPKQPAESVPVAGEEVTEAALSKEEKSEGKGKTLAGERQSGDGQPGKKLDDDEDRQNPAYIPRKGLFFEHDVRGAAQEEDMRPKGRQKKLWKDEGRWVHDKFREDEQAPKSREELVSVYGYDIRHPSGPSDLRPQRSRKPRYSGSPPAGRDKRWSDSEKPSRTPWQSGTSGNVANHHHHPPPSPQPQHGAPQSSRPYEGGRNSTGGSGRVAQQPRTFQNSRTAPSNSPSSPYSPHGEGRTNVKLVGQHSNCERERARNYSNSHRTRSEFQPPRHSPNVVVEEYRDEGNEEEEGEAREYYYYPRQSQERDFPAQSHRKEEEEEEEESTLPSPLPPAPEPTPVPERTVEKKSYSRARRTRNKASEIGKQGSVEETLTPLQPGEAQLDSPAQVLPPQMAQLTPPGVKAESWEPPLEGGSGGLEHEMARMNLGAHQSWTPSQPPYIPGEMRVPFQGPIYTHSESPAPLPPQGMMVQPEMHLAHPEILLDDFMLTHPIFLSADKLQQVLLQEYPSHNATPRPDACHSEGGGGTSGYFPKFRADRKSHEGWRRFDTADRKQAILSVAFRYLETYRHLLQEEGEKSQVFPKELCVCALQDLTVYPELVEEVLKLQRWTETLQDQALEESDSKKPVRPLFRHFRRVDACLQPREAFRGSDEIFCRVYTPDHSYVTIRSPLSSSVQEILALVSEKLQYSGEQEGQQEAMVLVAVTSSGEKAVFRPSEDSVFTTLGVPLPEEIHWSPGDSRLHDMSAEEVANQLLAFDWELFSCVHEVEFVRYVFRGEEARWRPLNLELVLQRCSEVQHWVGTEILQCQSLPKRGQLLRKFIKIAVLCKQNQDLLSFFSVVLGLNNPALSRLRHTWEDPSRNHKSYRDLLSSLRAPVIPFTPLLLKALDTDSSPSYLQAKAFVRQLQVIDNQNLLFNMSYKLEPKDT
ncbi:Rap guanine nucleotide exchange factor-like 1 [Acipenser ruthenus]|uniref:Protein CASC3 n=1 Tax=Acipenser ruthenus TaxID=7906 RepID=A0A444UHV7_ACIRT|nr:Rap guanine nucleotide exchange factor-like 1 [Acipenser ruthenus]